MTKQMEKAKVLKAYFSCTFSLVRSVSWPPRPPEPSARACGNAIGMMLWSRTHGDGWQESSFEKKKKKTSDAGKQVGQESAECP